MLYIREYKEDGSISFVPIRDDNVYIHCHTCGRLILVTGPSGFVAQLRVVTSKFDDDFDERDECMYARLEEEDEYLSNK